MMEALRPLPARPHCTRDQALVILARVLGRTPHLHEQLYGWRELEVGVALADLELAFGISLEVYDEIHPHITVAELLVLVQTKAELRARPPVRGGVQLYDLMSYRSALGHPDLLQQAVDDADRWAAVPANPPPFVHPILGSAADDRAWHARPLLWAIVTFVGWAALLSWAALA
jgi:hypothetical protein